MDEDAGVVVGMVLGSQMDGSRVDGMRGWGAPAEVIFEVGFIPLNTVSENANTPSRCLAFLVWRGRSNRVQCEVSVSQSFIHEGGYPTGSMTTARTLTW